MINSLFTTPAEAIKHTATIIFLHGLGDNGESWSREMETVCERCVKIVCPSATSIPVTLNNGLEMPAWFDLKGLKSTSAEDIEGINNAARYVHSLIEAEIRAGIPSDRIIVGGFSQGGGLALYAGLTFPSRLAGIIALSCRMYLKDTFSPSMVTGNKDVPILQCHGDRDDIVPYSYGQSTASLLSKFSKNVDFRTYDGLMHSASMKEMNDIKNFTKRHLPAV